MVSLTNITRGMRAALARVLSGDGQAVDTGDLGKQQSAGLVGLHREWASHPARGLTPAKLHTILEAAEQGDVVAQFELFEDMEERDGHIASEFGKRRRALLGLDWDVVPPPTASAKEKDAAAKVKEIIEGLQWETVLLDMTDGIGKGFACLEIDWQRRAGIWRPRNLDHRPQTWFQFHRGEGREEIRLRDGSSDGAILQPFGWVTHCHKAKSGYMARGALFRSLVWPYLFKNYSIGDLAEFLEIYGIPLRLGKYPAGASEADKRTLLRALASIGHNAAGIIPDGMMLEFREAATGDPDAFMAMIDWAERTQSKVIVGSTLTSQADRGSNTNALGNVHNEVRHDIRDSDARQLEGTITRDLVQPIALLNGWATSPDRAPRFRMVTQEPEDLDAFSKALPALVKLGFRINRSWAQERAGIPEPEPGDEILGEIPAPDAAPPPPPGAKPKPAPGADPAADSADQPGAQAAASAQLATPEPADLIADRLTIEAAPAHADWLDRIRRMVDSATSLEQLREQLLAAYGELPSDDLAKVMQAAFAVSDLVGRYDAGQESASAR